jgi:hypothetical protein
MTSQAYQWGETTRGVQQRDDRAYARITKAAERSAAATFRNIQPLTTFDAISASCATFRNIPAHNTIVIMQTTQTAFHKQRKRDNANNTSVMMVSRRTYNAIVISRSHRQAFVTFRNISSAYLSYRLSLYSTPVLLCGYAHTTISVCAHMRIKAYNGSVMM